VSEPSDTPAHRATKGRSPSYPGISLKVAIDRAKTVYGRERRNPAPIGAITSGWGYKSHTTGPASVTYAALLKFGLLADEGNGANRVAQLTDLAIDIIMKPDPTQEVQRAALTPPMNREVWEKYGNDLPSDETLRYWLVRERSFTETGWQDFIRQYRETMAFAKPPVPATLDEGEANPAEEGTSDAERTDNEDQRDRNRGQNGKRSGMTGDVMTLAVPIIGGAAVTVEGQFPISEAAWGQFLAVLNAMKPGLVLDTPPDDD
jgi:hypothetical protein